MKTLKQIREKSVSQAQQKMMGMALAYKRGELDNASPEVKKMADSMSMKDLEDFAKTKHKGLPVKKESVELGEAKFKVGDEVMRTDKDNAPSGKIVKVLPDDKYLIKYTSTKTVGDEKVSAKDLYLLSGKKKKANEEVELDEAKKLDEISPKLARKAAAASSAKSFEYGNYAYDDESQKNADRLDRKSDKAYAYIMKRQGQKGIDKTNRLASKLIYGKSRYMESVELDEELWKDIETYANKHGGIDKKDMLKVAMMLKKGDRKGAVKYARGLDTDPRDWLLDKMNEGLDEAMGPKPPKLKGNNGPYTRQQIEKAAKEAKVDMGAKARMMMKLRDMK